MINKKRSVLILLFLFFLLKQQRSFSQQLNYTLNRDFLWGVDAALNSKEQNNQTFIKPYTFETVKNIKDSTAVFPRLLAGTKAEERDKKAQSQIEIYPLLNTSAGYESGTVNRFSNDLAIGAHLLGYLGNKFAFSFKALGGKTVFNSFTDSIAYETNVNPGIGYVYRSNNDSVNQQYAYQYFSGYIAYVPNKIFNIQLGQDKHFWGDGYRSLFLSDNTAPYPYMKITTNVWKLTYTNLFTIMRDATNPSGMKKDWLFKYSTLHHLGWNATKRINIGVFESVVWQGSDSTRFRGYDINYLNPIIFFRPTEYSLGSSDNAFVGFNFKIKLFKKQQVYGQLLLDEFLLKEVAANKGWWANKQAFQIGVKSFDMFKIKHFNFQTEFNYVRPYTYAHGSVQQNYGHMNQALAHPLGANFWESISFMNYRYKRLFIEGKLQYAVYGGDSAGTDYGKNIFISYKNRPSDYGNFTTQGFQTNLITASLRAAYILDTRMNLKIELGGAYRVEERTHSTKQTPYFFIGLRTDLSNIYTDI